MFVLREFPTVMEECFQAPVEGAIYAEAIDKLRVEGAIKPWIVDNSALTHTCWDLGSPVNTVVWYFQIGPREIRVIDCDLDFDIPPVERVSRMLGKGYLYGSHFLPHDAQATQKSGRTFLMELKEAGLPNCRAVPRTHDIWVGINRLRQMLPRFSFRIPQCERGLEALSNYHTIRESSTGIAKDEPCHDWSSHAADSLRVIAEAEAANMLRGAAGVSRGGAYRGGIEVLTGFRGSGTRHYEPDILDAFLRSRPECAPDGARDPMSVLSAERKSRKFWIVSWNGFPSEHVGCDCGHSDGYWWFPTAGFSTNIVFETREEARLHAIALAVRGVCESVGKLSKLYELNTNEQSVRSMHSTSRSDKRPLVELAEGKA